MVPPSCFGGTVTIWSHVGGTHRRTMYAKSYKQAIWEDVVLQVSQAFKRRWYMLEKQNSLIIHRDEHYIQLS